MNPVYVAYNGLKDATVTFGQNLHELLSNTVEDGPNLIPRHPVVDTLKQHKVLLVGLLSLLVPYLSLQLVCWCCRRSKNKPDQADAARRVESGNRSISTGTGNTSTGRHLLMNAAYEAKRWFRQAEHDLDAARHDMDQTDPAYEWACFKCHQAAEKAVKSSLLHHRQQFDAVHDLSELSLHTQDRYLISLCNKLQNTLGLTGQMRYPDFLVYPKIPHDVHTAEQAQHGLQVSRDLLNYIRQALRLPGRPTTTENPPVSQVTQNPPGAPYSRVPSAHAHNSPAADQP